MIMIYSVDPATGALYTDKKQHFYIDAGILQEKAKATRAKYLKDRIAQAVGYPTFDAMDCYLRSIGVDPDVRDAWILDGTFAERIGIK